MPVCPYCLHVVDASSKFCRSCGKPINNVKCVKCGAELVSDAKFCKKCGTPVPKFCPQCGCILNLKAKFCSKCGKEIPATFWMDANICLKCGNPLKIGAKFCSVCGESSEHIEKNENNSETIEKEPPKEKSLECKSAVKENADSKENVPAPKVARGNFSGDVFSEKKNKSFNVALVFILLTIGLVVGGVYYFVNNQNDGASKYANEVLTTYLKLQNAYFLEKETIGTAWGIGLNVEDTPDFKNVEKGDKSFGLISQRNIKGCPQFSTWEIYGSVEKEHKKEKVGQEYWHHFIKRLHYDCLVNVKFDAEHAEKSAACEKLVPDFKSMCDDVYIDTVVSIESTMRDNRDGKIYKTIKIADQTWMGENLNFKMDSSWCYGDVSTNCNKHGRLYTWEAAVRACPVGWHLPDMSEYEKLFSAVGGEQIAGYMLKSSQEWQKSKKVKNGIDAMGFSVFPVGAKSNDGRYYYVGYYAYLWTSTAEDTDYAYYVNFNYEKNGVKKTSESKNISLNVRCVKN